MKIIMPKYKDLEPQYQQRFKDTLFFIESTMNEYHLFWREYRFEQMNPGVYLEVGRVGKYPVCATFMWVKLEGELLCFYHGSSQVVDATMIEEWIRKNFNPKWDKGTRFAHCDSSNTHHAINAIEEKIGRKVKQDHYCAHQDCERHRL